MNRDSEIPLFGKRLQANGFTICLVLAAMFGNKFLITMAADFSSLRTTGFELLIFVIAGIMAAQACLLSVWCAMGGQIWIERIAMSMGTLIVLTAEYLRATYHMQPNMVEVVTFAVLPFVLTVLIQPPLWIYRLVSSKAICLSDPNLQSSDRMRFGIKNLMGGNGFCGDGRRRRQHGLAFHWHRFSITCFRQ